MKDEALFQHDPVLHRSIHQYDNAHWDSRSYASVILLDGQEVACMLRCCHCGGHFLNVKVPGQERGWCSYCNAPVCPKKECDHCVPFWKWVEAIEKGIPLDQLPIKAAIRGAYFER